MSVLKMFRFLAEEQVNRGRGWRLIDCHDEARACARRARYWHRCWIEQRIAETGWPEPPANGTRRAAA